MSFKLRQSLSSFRTMGGMLAGMVIMVGAPLMIYDKIDGKEVLNDDDYKITCEDNKVYVVIYTNLNE